MHGLLGFCFYIGIMFINQVWVHGEMDPTREFITINESWDVEGLNT
jgi:hypothetical protein